MVDRPIVVVLDDTPAVVVLEAPTVVVLETPILVVLDEPMVVVLEAPIVVVLVGISELIAASTLMRGTEPDGDRQEVAMLTPVLCSAASKLVTLPPGRACFINAQAPVTCGVAMDVPLHDSYDVSESAVEE